MDKTFLYEVIIGAVTKVVDVAAQPAVAEVPAVTDQNGNVVTPAVPAVAAVEEQSHLNYQDRVDLKNVAAKDVQDAISKLPLGEGQFYNSVTRLQEIHA